MLMILGADDFAALFREDYSPEALETIYGYYLQEKEKQGLLAKIREAVVPEEEPVFTASEIRATWQEYEDLDAFLDHCEWDFSVAYRATHDMSGKNIREQMQAVDEAFASYGRSEIRAQHEIFELANGHCLVRRKRPKGWDEEE